jgi:hypothetical protein
VLTLEGKRYRIVAIGRRFATLMPAVSSKGVQRRYVELTELPAGGPDAA